MSKDGVIILGDFSLEPAEYSEARAEKALPGTSVIPQALVLEQPPAPPPNPVPLEERDYGPDDVAEYSVRFDASTPFSCRDMYEALLKIRWSRLLESPSYYVVTPSGQTTYLISSDGPTEGVALIAAWSFREIVPPEVVEASAAKLARWLSRRREGFKGARAVSFAEIDAQIDRVIDIQMLGSERVECLVYPEKPGVMFDGGEVWHLLHSMGFHWGDMDCFQWPDETGQTDYLIWVEAYDNEFNYALPEYIASGRQHFNAISFSFDPARSPAPLHVLGEMLKAAAFFQNETGCRVAARIDGEVVEGAEQLIEAVRALIEGLSALGLKPGSDSVCRLR